MSFRGVAALALVLHATAAAPPAAPAPPARRALILYDGTSINHREGTIDAAHVANLLGHFGFAGVQEPVESYRAGEMSAYDVVFVVAGAEQAPMPAALVSDARAASRPLVWAGYQLDRLLPAADAARRGVSVDGYLHESPYDRVRYRGVDVGKGSRALARITVSDPARVRVEATALDPGGGELPYIVHAGNVWAIADVPFAYVDERDRYLVFCDILHDILGVAHGVDHRALIRLEDVTPEDDPALVRRTVDAFAREGVPFQIALVPIYRDAPGSREVTLSDRPDLVAALHDAVTRGGTIVMHGVTHQYHGVSPDDFEFWDDERNQRRPDDSAELVRRKLDAGLAECLRNGIYPVAWETPHYTASLLDYAEVAKVFSAVNERRLTTEAQGTQQFFPYPTIDVRGSLVIPEDLGYLPAANPDPAVLVANARTQLVVRDSIASAYVHDFLDPAAFTAVIRGVKALGYRYVSLREFPTRVNAGDRLIATAGASGTVTLDDQFLHELVIGADGRPAHDQYSRQRLKGTVGPTLAAGAGEILVATGAAALPAAPPAPPGRLRALADRVLAAVATRTLAPPKPRVAFTAALVWNQAFGADAANDQESYRRMLLAYGVTPRVMAAADLTRTLSGSRDVLIVPAPSARALSPDQIASVNRFVRAGGQLITDGRSPLIESFGVTYGARVTSVGSIRDEAALDARLRWRPLVALPAVHLPAGATALATDVGSDAPVLAMFDAAAGRVLFAAADFDPYTTDGTSRYPFLFEHALSAFGRDPLARRAGVELYFDPGLRPSVSIEALAAMWQRLGVRAVYAAAWEFDSNYSYDYERLLRVCHEHGILVYAWFEFPYVSRLFWERHPEWREVPAQGTTLPSWRLAMNLANPACRAAALQFLHDVVTRWPWDGVNLAELNFDGVADGDNPAQSVPMNADVRARWREAHGFDPIELFNPAARHWWKRDTRAWDAWLDWRSEFVAALHRDFLAALRPFAESGREVIVTALDSLQHPDVRDDTGLDSTDIVDLMNEFAFTLQVEDPAVSWADPPRRYEKLVAAYRAIVPRGRLLMVDINVVPARDVSRTHLPLPLASGTELVATVKAARSAADRVAIYGDATIRPRDLELVAAAFADRARVEWHALTWTVDTPVPVDVFVPSTLHDFYIDGREWPYWRPGWVLVPSGHSVLTTYRPWMRLFDLSSLRPHVRVLAATLESADPGRGRLTFEYSSDTRALAVLDRRPREAVIDGRDSAEIVAGGSRAIVMVLPPGHHRVDVAGSDRAAVLFELLSVVSSSLIVAFGTAACGLLAFLYIAIMVRRRFQREQPSA